MKTINTYYEDQNGFSEFVRQHQHILFSKKNTAMLVQVFCSRNEIEYIKQLALDIFTELPMAYVIGTSTAGVIINGEVSGRSTVISITVFQQTVLRIGGFRKGDQDDFALGRHIATTLDSGKSKVLLLFGAGETVQFELVLKGIEAEKPQLLIAGGSAGKSSRTHPAFVFYNQDIIEAGFVGVALEGEDLDVHLYSHLGWQAIGKKLMITEAKGNRVYTINSIPAYQVYRRYLGIDKECNFLNAVEFPLIVNRNGFPMARTPKAYYDDDSIGFAGDLIQGELARLSFGDAGLISEMIDQLCREIQQSGVESIFVYSCESRRGFLQDLSNIEILPLQKLAPTAGFFTSGEYYQFQGVNQLLNATMAVLVMAEKGGILRDTDELPNNDYLSPDSVCPLYPDGVEERSTGVLKALTHLINTVTAELEAANHTLHYIGLHDSLTGIYNRTFFDRNMKKFNKLDDAIGIIICDMDCLKLVNDTLGHEFGDRMIKLFASILQESCRKEDIVSRIGGDEFAVLVKGATDDVLTTIRTRIEVAAHEARERDKNNLLYLSVGFARREKGSTKSLSEVFTEADNAMYTYKSKNKESVRTAIIQSFSQMNRKVVDFRS